MRRTRIAITEHARKLTAAHGLSGFTVEDVCEPAGISRRTFFNYFASKEAAVIGTPPDVLQSDAMRAFMAAGIPDGRLSDTLLEDLVEVVTATIDEVLHIAGTVTQINAIIAREPTFMDKFITESETLHGEFMRLIIKREGLADTDPRPRLAVQLLGSLMHSTMHSYFACDNTGSIGPKLRQALVLTRELFVPGSALESPLAAPPSAAR